MTIRWRVAHSCRLIDALRERVSGSHSARSLKRALETNVCRVNGRVERFASTLLQKGDEVEFSDCWKALDRKDSESLVILHENEELVAVNKPSHTPCTEGYFREKLGYPVWMVHRLDKETTGVLLLAKSARFAEEAQRMFAKRQMEKEYLAIVDGKPSSSHGMQQSYLAKKSYFQGQVIWGSHEKGLFAQTDWWCLSSSSQGISLMRCQPKTGRTHQIRVHLAELGCPILIDRQYASRFRSAVFAMRPLLHARRLSFEWLSKAICIEAPIPGDFEKILLSYFQDYTQAI